MPVLVQCGIYDHSKDSAGYDFPDAYGQHHKRNRERYLVSVAKDKRYDQYISKNGRQGGKKSAFAAQLPCKDGANQSGKTAKNNVRQNTASKDVADQASDKQPGDSSRGKMCIRDSGRAD